ncbi:MAG: CARDB domain-containing protein [Bacteroidales bacterium]|nr:CARDB domain-containing protein [Bacteroidales bacterium]MDZ4204157.1 CARDB domain-containing protein [Bacteroidales bacterium]
MTAGRPSPIITDACLETTIRVVSSGTGHRMVSAAPPPPIATDPNGPDLRILEVKPVIRRTGVFIPIVSNIKAAASGDPLITVDTDATIVIKIQNIGRLRAENVRTHLEYNIADRWVPYSEAETIKKLETGRDVTLRIPMVLPKGAIGIKIIIDPFNEIREIDEYNNILVGFFGRK